MTRIEITDISLDTDGKSVEIPPKVVYEYEAGQTWAELKEEVASRLAEDFACEVFGADVEVFTESGSFKTQL